MVKELTFGVHYDNDLAYEYYGGGEKLAKQLREVYHDNYLEIPDEFDPSSTYPPIHFIRVSAPDGIDVDDLRNVEVPSGLSVDIMEFDD